MNIAILLPMIILTVMIPLFVVFKKGKRKKKIVAILKNKNKKRGLMMSNEVIKKEIGSYCEISTLDAHVEGKIISVNDNWIEVQAKNNIEWVNANFIEKIKIISK